MSESAAPAALLAAASAYYKPAGRLRLAFRTGKLKGDPAFRAILAQGLLSGRERLLDLGAGQGLLAAWLLAARSCHASERAGAWPRGWPAPPELALLRGHRDQCAGGAACAARVRARHRRCGCKSCTGTSVT